MPSIANAKKQRNLNRADGGASTTAGDEGSVRTEPDLTPEIVGQRLKTCKSEPRLATLGKKCFSSSPEEHSGKKKHKKEIFLAGEDNESGVSTPVPTPIPYRNPATAVDGGRNRKCMSQIINRSFIDFKESFADDMEKLKRSGSRTLKKNSDKLETRSMSGISVSSTGMPKVEATESQTKAGEAPEKTRPKWPENAQDTGAARRFANVFAEVCPGEVGIWDCVAGLKQHRMSLQGRLYLSDKSLCFSSPFSKKLTVIPLTTINRIVRRKWAALPSAIRVVCTNGNRYIFHSMVFRNQCYAEMLQLCQKCNPGLPLAVLMGGEDEESAGTDGENSIGVTENGGEEEAGPVECGCRGHYSKKFIDTVVGVSAGRLFDMMFGDNTAFMQDYAGAALGYTSYTASAWAPDPANQTQKRVVSFIMPLKKNPIGPKTAYIEDIQTLEKKVESKLYVINSESCTPKLPYGDSMVTCNKFCITWHSRKRCRLVVTSDIMFKKSVLGPVKYAIVKSSMSIMAESHSSLLTAIEAYLGGAPTQPSKNALTIADKTDAQEAAKISEPVEWWAVAQQATALPVLTILMALTVLLALLHVARTVATLQDAVDHLTHAIHHINS